MNAPRISRALLGNLAVAAMLAIAAWLLLRLHLGESWWLAAPLPVQWWVALAALVLYTGACFALWWHVRPPREVVAANGEPPVLIVWASQTGFAQQLAERTAESLRAAGLHTRLRPLEQVDASLLADTRKAVFVASTTGEGDPPDHALAFLSRVMPEPLALPQLQHAVLALGDRSYDNFCAFGHQLDEWLRERGAQPLFDTIDVDNADPAALRHWQQLLGQLGGDASDVPDWSPPAYQPWHLQDRRLLNPGSVGGPVFQLQLQPEDAALLKWEAGDIAEVGPRQSPAAVAQWMHDNALPASSTLTDGRLLRDVLAASQLPEQRMVGDITALLASLKPLPHREYSIASMPTEGHLQLLLRRQMREDGTPGLASGWLCDFSTPGQSIDLRVRSNRNFHLPVGDVPLVLIGNGTGIAGLRAHLRARIDAGARRNWLLFGERNAAHDFHFGDELRQWQHDGWIEHLDTVFSRDGGEHRYVQDVLAAHAQRLRAWVEAGATVLVCGSLQGMAPAVDAVIIGALGAPAHEALRLAGRYRRDVY